MPSCSSRARRDSAAAFRDRFGALRNLPRLFRLVWSTSSGLTLATIGLRLLRAILPTAALYVGKLIINAVVSETRLPHPGPGFSDWLVAGRLTHVALLVLAEAALGVPEEKRYAPADLDDHRRRRRIHAQLLVPTGASEEHCMRRLIIQRPAGPGGSAVR